MKDIKFKSNISYEKKNVATGNQLLYTGGDSHGITPEFLS